MRVEVDGLGYTIRGKALLRDVAFTLEPGRTLAVVGPNGSGKSTLLRLLAGLIRPGAGRIEVDGTSLTRMSRRQIAQRMAIVEQQADTTERVTVRSVVALGRTPWLSAMQPWSGEDEAAVRKALETVDMKDFADREWSTLSGGEKQRLHIARALAQRPGLLLLDEPTNHLDIHHQLSILDCVRDLRVTTILALHDLNQAMTCDRVAVLSAGRIVAAGAPRETLQNDLLSEIFGVSVTRLDHPGKALPFLSFHL